MSKKNTGLLIAFGAAIGAAAAGISYYLKYKSFNDDLNKDFHDYEEEDGNTDENEAETVSCEKCAGRSYITLGGAKKDTEASEAPAASSEEEPTASVKDEPAAPAKEEPKSEGVTVEEDMDGAGA